MNILWFQISRERHPLLGLETTRLNNKGRTHRSRTSHHALFVEAGDAPHLCLVHSGRGHSISHHRLVNWMKTILKILNCCQILLHCIHLDLEMILIIKYKDLINCYYVTFLKFYRAVIMYARFPIKIIISWLTNGIKYDRK